MNSLNKELRNKIIECQFNDFGRDNYDELRFGDYQPSESTRLMTVRGFYNFFKKVTGYRKGKILKSKLDFLKEYEVRLQKVYSNLDPKSKKIYIELLAYRALGYKKVKLSKNNNAYWDAIKIAKSLSNINDTYNPNFMHFILQKYYLGKIGFEIDLYFLNFGIAVDYILEQYAYKINNKPIVEVEKGDVVLDLGACWGDTALYFAHKAGKQGKVYSFEFIPGNINLFQINLNLNPILKERIELIQHPVSQKSGDTIYYSDNGPGSSVKFEPFVEQTGSCTTLSIDDFVNNNNIERIDFIKMDIEGAETMALEGAVETIKKFKPKLAIAIYHSLEDFANIPLWIINLNLGYKLYLDHYSIHSEETVLFAIAK